MDAYLRLWAWEDEEERCSVRLPLLVKGKLPWLLGHFPLVLVRWVSSCGGADKRRCCGICGSTLRVSPGSGLQTFLSGLLEELSNSSHETLS